MLGGVVNTAVPVEAVEIAPAVAVKRMVEPEGENIFVQLAVEKIEVFSGVEFRHFSLIGSG